MNHKLEQLASEIREAVQGVLNRGLADPRVSGLITITSVRLTPDLARADITVSIIPEDRQKLAFHGIRAATTHIRNEIRKKIQGRRLPHLQFELDESFKKQAHVLTALEQARTQSKPATWGSPPSSPDDAPNPGGTES
jgi:ribosome-binding factor A